MSEKTRSGTPNTPVGAAITRRSALLGLAALALQGCAGSRADSRRLRAMYGPVPEEQFAIPAVNLSQVPAKYYRREINYVTDERPGTIVVDPDDKYLYLVQRDQRAMRYGIGVGREGFAWSGRAHVGRKQHWPTWTPPREMIEREPELEEYANGMPPGLDNPLGARALYLYQDGRDTLYRLHGTNEAYSIGKAVSSGCIRLLNQDVIDLHDRVQPGAQVVVLGNARLS